MVDPHASLPARFIRGVCCAERVCLCVSVAMPTSTESGLVDMATIIKLGKQ